jgi:hypothetical protein
MSREKVTLKVELMATPFAAFAGVEDVTNGGGGVVVLKIQMYGARIWFVLAPVIDPSSRAV